MSRNLEYCSDQPEGNHKQCIRDQYVPVAGGPEEVAQKECGDQFDQHERSHDPRDSIHVAGVVVLKVIASDLIEEGVNHQLHGPNYRYHSQSCEEMQ
jgi:hypothetical protein